MFLSQETKTQLLPPLLYGLIKYLKCSVSGLLPAKTLGIHLGAPGQIPAQRLISKQRQQALGYGTNIMRIYQEPGIPGNFRHG